MPRIPMPSPTGTNYAGRFLPASFPFVNEPTMAMDSALMFNTREEAAAWRRKYRGGMAFDAPIPPATIERLLKFVAPKLSSQDFAQVRGLLTIADDPMVRGPNKEKMYSPDIGNKHTPWTEEDEILRTPAYGTDARFPEIARIAMDGYGMRATPRRTVSMTSAQLVSFEERFPDTKRIGHA
jgi:hypothetical protein